MKKIKDAVNHFRYKLNPKNNIWKATEKDVDNLNLIMDFVEQKQSDYTLFAKVFISSNPRFSLNTKVLCLM